MAQHPDVYARMGIAAILPGLTRAIEVLQAEVNHLREALDGPAPMVKRRGRPPKALALLNGAVPVPTALEPAMTTKEKQARGNAGYWAKLSPEERSKEVKRRMRLAKKKAGPPTHPRDSRHPKHAAWVKKMKVAWAAGRTAKAREAVQ